MIKIETHCHIKGGSYCGKCTTDDIVNRYVEQGYGAVILTHHYSKTCPFEAETKQKQIEKVDFLYSLFNELNTKAVKKGLKIFFAVEVRLVSDGTEYVLIGFDKDFFYKHPALYDLTQVELFNLANENGFFMYQTHPFREGVTARNPKYMHGAECFNGHFHHVNNNAPANEFCDKNGLIKMAGTDFHEGMQPITSAMYIPKNIDTEKQLAEYFLTGKAEIFSDEEYYQREMKRFKLNRIRLASHNIWNRDSNSPEWEKNGEDCSANARVSGLVRVYKDLMPDIIGCQESSSLMADLLSQNFEKENLNYTIIWGRFTPIIYRSDKFELVESFFKTYPEEIEGFSGIFNDVKSKAFNIGVFRVKESGKVFVFATTHLWWKQSPSDKLFSQGSDYQEFSDEAREYQLSLLTEKVKYFCDKYNCPAVVVGDMNTDYNSKAIQTALSCGFKHAHNIATEYSEEKVGYHNCFPWGYEKKYFDTPFEKAIDHILLFNEPDGLVKRFERYSPEYYFPISDHSPVYIDVEL
jgi:hypothetical protein